MALDMSQIIICNLISITLIAIMIIGPMKIMFSSGSWKTQTVLYQNGHLTFKKVQILKTDLSGRGQYLCRLYDVDIAE